MKKGIEKSILPETRRICKQGTWKDFTYPFVIILSILLVMIIAIVGDKC
jgi:hypothetical protein